MQNRSLARCAFLVALVSMFGLTLLWQGCSEEEAVQTDETAPVVVLAMLITPAPDNPEVQDTIDVTSSAFGFTSLDLNDWVELAVWAEDDQAVSSVEIWCSFHADTIPTHIATLEETDAFGLYRHVWNVQPFGNGARGIVWAIANDAAGNKGRTKQDVPIRVVTGEQNPPNIRFSISPFPSGEVTRVFTFDPSATTDDLDPDYAIKVRWDFDGDGIWDIDTTAGINASQIVTHLYTLAPRDYDVVCQGWNSYFLGSGSDTVTIQVDPEGGEPRPMNPEDFRVVGAGVYPLGVHNTTGGTPTGYDLSEMVDSLLYVKVTNAFRIEAFEVTNELYAAFLDSARAASAIDYDPYSLDQIVYWSETGVPLIKLQEDLTYVRFLDEQTGFGVDEVYKKHPVTGVTWYGAFHYAKRFGLRLPSEAEWEAAARAQNLDTAVSGTYLYPWEPSDVIDPMYANYKNSGDPFEASGNLRASTPVGAYNGTYMGTFPTVDAVGPFETYDQAGNVAEWVKDWYDGETWGDLLLDYFDTGNPPLDPQGPMAGTYRVIRGGNFFDKVAGLRVTKRQGADPGEFSAKVGFRTVYTDPEGN